MKRKKISTKIKTRILEETYKTGSVIAEIARKHGISTELIYSWRTKYKKNNNSGNASGAVQIPALLDNNEYNNKTKFIEVTVNDMPTEVVDIRNKSVLQKVLLEYEGVTVTIEGGQSRKVLPEIMKVMEMATC